MALGRVIRTSLLSSAADLRTTFAAAAPFPHVVIDDFFDDAFARRLLGQFPPAGNASRNLYGAAGKKAFHRNLRRLGDAYEAADAFFASPEFSNWVGQLTGIPNLVYDSDNFGGGTHENFEGRDLRPHVDFNYHPVTRLHRRLNVIVYLNEGWQPEWGGSIALWGDPRDPAELPVEYAPIFNRCIIFETSERSWHGFERIRLPEGEKHHSRKSLSIYLYTRERPESEIHREHTTFFIPRALPPTYVAGHVLTAADEEDLGELLDQRDNLIELYQSELGRSEADSAQAARLRIALAHFARHQHVPVLGYVRQIGAVEGLGPSGTVQTAVTFTVRAERPVQSIEVCVRAAHPVSNEAALSLLVDGERRAETAFRENAAQLACDVRIARGAQAQIRIVASEHAVFSIEDLVFEHVKA